MLLPHTVQTIFIVHDSDLLILLFIHEISLKNTLVLRVYVLFDLLSMHNKGWSKTNCLKVSQRHKSNIYFDALAPFGIIIARKCTLTITYDIWLENWNDFEHLYINKSRVIWKKVNIKLSQYAKLLSWKINLASIHTLSLKLKHRNKISIIDLSWL